MPYVGGQEKCRMGALKPKEINDLLARWKRPGADTSDDYVEVEEELTDMSWCVPTRYFHTE